MGESSAWLATLILTGYMTADEADKVWRRMVGTPIPGRPSEIAQQVEFLLAQVRREAWGFGGH